MAYLDVTTTYLAELAVGHVAWTNPSNFGDPTSYAEVVLTATNYDSHTISLTANASALPSGKRIVLLQYIYDREDIVTNYTGSNGITENFGMSSYRSGGSGAGWTAADNISYTANGTYTYTAKVPLITIGTRGNILTTDDVKDVSFNIVNIGAFTTFGASTTADVTVKIKNLILRVTYNSGGLLQVTDIR